MTELLYPREVLEKRLGKPDPADRHRAALYRLADAVFFASLMLEEGEHVPVAVVYVEDGCADLAGVVDSEPGAWGSDEPPPAWRVTELQRRKFAPEELVKLARGLRYRSQVIVVAGRDPDLEIVGFARREPGTDGGAVALFTAPRPGVLIIEQEGAELLHYDNGREECAALPVVTSQGPVRAALEAIARPSDVDSASWAVSTLLREMRAANAGGILALLPAPPGDSVLKEITYRPADEALLSKAIDNDRKTLFWRIAVAHTGDSAITMEQVEVAAEARQAGERARTVLLSVLEDLGALSAVDGALLLGPGLAVYGAGHFIPASTAKPPPDLLLASDVDGKSFLPERPNFGARHRAANDCAFDNEGSVVFVISEDGPVHCVKKWDQGRLMRWPVYIH